MKKYLAAVGLWLLPPIIFFLLPFDMPRATSLVVLLTPLAGLVLLVGLLVALIKSRTRSRPAAFVLAVILIGGAVHAGGIRWAAQIHLFANRHRYESIVAKLALARLPVEREQICGDDCFVVSQEPLRVAFHFCHCFLYWPDIVYDPTGEVAGTDISRLHQLNMYLFGGDHLRGPWYLGNFGD